jgi:archaemetzincin
MNMQTITLVSFGQFSKDILEKTAEAVIGEYNCPVNIRDGHLDMGDFFDAARRQYNGNALLKQVQSMSFPESDKSLGIFNVDLFIPILTFIFGQAFLGGGAAIASVYRLSNERYGMKPDEELLIERLKKEAIHELGHTFGLIHCRDPLCVMHSSTYVEDIDQKSQHLCFNCKSVLLI